MGSLWSLEGFGGPGAIWVLDAPGLSPLGWGFREDLGIQGEFRPNSLGALPVLELLKAAIGKAGYMDKVVIGMHMAASEFCHEGKYDMDFNSPPWIPSSSSPGSSWGSSTRASSRTTLVSTGMKPRGHQEGL